MTTPGWSIWRSREGLLQIHPGDGQAGRPDQRFLLWTDGERRDALVMLAELWRTAGWRGPVPGYEPMQRPPLRARPWRVLAGARR